MNADIALPLTLIAMAAITYSVRCGGVLIVSRITLTGRAEAFLNHMSTSVLIAIVVPATLDGAPRIWAAVLLALLAMYLTKRVFVAMLVGVAVAATGRAIG